MISNYRSFQVTDAFGQTWRVEFLWLQTAISIRHADAVDVKFRLTAGSLAEEKVIALPHPELLALSGKLARPLTDSWCMKLGALHLKRMLETGADIEKTLVTCDAADMERAHDELMAAAA
jgi:hypothetical protein